MCVERHAPEAVKNVPYKELICAYKDPYKQKTRSSIELEGILQSYLSKIHIMSFHINTLIINPRFVPDLPHYYAFSYRNYNFTLNLSTNTQKIVHAMPDYFT